MTIQEYLQQYPIPPSDLFLRILANYRSNKIDPETQARDAIVYAETLLKMYLERYGQEGDKEEV